MISSILNHRHFWPKWYFLPNSHIWQKKKFWPKSHFWSKSFFWSKISYNKLALTLEYIQIYWLFIEGSWFVLWTWGTNSKTMWWYVLVEHWSIVSSRQSYTYQVLQTIQMKLMFLCVWAEPAVLGSTKTAPNSNMNFK